MHKPNLTDQEKRAAETQLREAYDKLREAADKIPVSDALSKEMLWALRAIAVNGLEEWDWK